MMIRQATHDDIPAIGQLWLELADYHYQLDPRLPQPASDGVARYGARVASALHDSHARVLVAEHEGEVVGYVIGTIVDLLPEMFAHEISGFIADIYVRASHRRHGYGSALVQILRDWFTLRGVHHMEWYVATNNQDALAFWHSIGGQDIIVRMRTTLNPTHEL